MRHDAISFCAIESNQTRENIVFPRRRSIRLKGYDYSLGGVYFVTISTHKRRMSLVEKEIRDMVALTWLDLPNHFGHVLLDDFVVMPNHFHGVLFFGPHKSPSNELHKRHPLSVVVGAFKSYSSRRINAVCGTPGVPVWQRSYYERVVRNDRELFRIREYIANNPKLWDRDRENPNRIVESEIYEWLYQ